LVGFLVYNRPPASIYLGDGGANMLGLAAGVLVIVTWTPAPVHLGVVLPSLLLVAIPLADTAAAILRRARAGASIFTGDRASLSDRLVDRGWPKSLVSVAVASAQLVFALLGALALGLDPGPAGVVAGLLLAIVGCSLWAAGFFAPTLPRRAS